MRSPIQDPNAGAATQVAPTKKHAVRTATIARNHSNDARQKHAATNKLASTLGTSLQKFMDDEREQQHKQRYTEAFYEQGTKIGLSEFQRDQKRTGFTKAIYSNKQSPEYQAWLDASARNATLAMYTEESDFIEGEGADLSPVEYQDTLNTKLTEFNKEHFSADPDAAFAFMKNWQKHSNVLAKQHVKLYTARQHAKARQTVAEGYQSALSAYKQMVKADPDAAIQLGEDIYSDKYKPSDMTDEAFRDVLISESLSGAMMGDFTSLKLFNDAGLQHNLTDKEKIKYKKAVTRIDNDNFNTLEAGRLAYETAILSEDPDAISMAQQQYNSLRVQVSARNSGSTKHMKTVFGADRWRGVLGTKYKKLLEDDAKEALEARVGEVEYNADMFDVEVSTAMLNEAEPSKKMDLLAERLDFLHTAIKDPTLDREVRQDLSKQIEENTKKLLKWKTAAQVQADKDKKILDEAKAKADELKAGVDRLNSGKGYNTFNKSDNKKHLEAAIKGKINALVPDPDMSYTDKVNAVVTNPMYMKNFLDAVGPFGMFTQDADSLKVTIKNLTAQLRAPNEANQYTQEQKQHVAALEVLREQNPTLYRAAFPTNEEMLEITALTRAINRDATISETNKANDALVKGEVNPNAFKLSGQKFISELGISGEDPYVQDILFGEYKRNLPLGHAQAMQVVKDYQKTMDPKVNGQVVRNGGTFGEVSGINLQDMITKMQVSYKTGDVYKSGFTHALAELVKGEETTKGVTLFRLGQVPGVRLSVLNGSLVMEYNNRRAIVPRDEIEAELNGYRQRAAARSSARRR